MPTSNIQESGYFALLDNFMKNILAYVDDNLPFCSCHIRSFRPLLQIIFHYYVFISCLAFKLAFKADMYGNAPNKSPKYVLRFNLAIEKTSNTSLPCTNLDIRLHV